jgi:hypothetical protein
MAKNRKISKEKKYFIEPEEGLHTIIGPVNLIVVNWLVTKS